jgi:hypothetical protein
MIKKSSTISNPPPQDSPTKVALLEEHRPPTTETGQTKEKCITEERMTLIKERAMQLLTRRIQRCVALQRENANSCSQQQMDQKDHVASPATNARFLQLQAKNDKLKAQVLQSKDRVDKIKKLHTENEKLADEMNKTMCDTVAINMQKGERIRELEERNKKLAKENTDMRTRHRDNAQLIYSLGKSDFDKDQLINNFRKSDMTNEAKMKEQKELIRQLRGMNKSQISAVEAKIQLLQEMVESQKAMRLELREENDRLKVRRVRDSQLINTMKTSERAQKREIAKVRGQMDAMMDAIYILVTQGSAETDEQEEEQVLEEELLDQDDLSTVGPTEEITCPLTREVFVEPVIDYEGNTYEKDAILEWLKTHPTSPITRSRLREDQLIPNRVLKNLILALAYD